MRCPIGESRYSPGIWGLYLDFLRTKRNLIVRVQHVIKITIITLLSRLIDKGF